MHLKITKIATLIFWLVVTILPIVGVVIGLADPDKFAATQDAWQTRILVFGIAAPIAFILLQAAQVVVAPINHYVVGVIGGFLYGPFLGAFLNWLGRVIGHVLAFSIARYFGRSLIEKYVSKKTIEVYDKHVSDKSYILFLMYFLPIFPDDELSYLAGFSKMKFKPFLLANIFGHVGGSLALAYVGSGIDTRDTLFWIIFVATFIVFWLLFFAIRKSSGGKSTQVTT